jgi:hypothetical protein
MKITLLPPMVLIIWLGIIPAHAQYAVSDREDVLLIRKTSLAVVLKEPNGKDLNRLAKKPEKLAAYKKLFEDYNAYLKEAVNNEWHLSKDVSFITEVEADVLRKTRNETVCLLETIEMLNRGDLSPSYVPIPQANSSVPRPNSQMRQRILARDAAIYDLDRDTGVPATTISWAAKPGKALVTALVPEYTVSRGTMTFCVQQLINQLVDAEQHNITSQRERDAAIEARMPALRSKTLLLCEEVIDKDLLEDLKGGKISKADYPYPFELVSYEKLNEAIVKKDARYAYAWVTPELVQNGNRQMYCRMIIDAKDGQLLFFSQKGDMEGKFYVQTMRKAGVDAASK